MSNPNPFVPKGSLLDQQSQRRSRLKLAVFCVLAVSVTGLVAMLIQGCKRTPEGEDASNPSTMTDSNSLPADTSTNLVTGTNAIVDTNLTAYAPPTGTNAMTTYTPPPVPVSPIVEPTAETTEYVVVSGDTLGKIAKRNGVSLKALEAANPGVDSKHLKVKQKLVIPAGGKTADVTGATSVTSTDSDSATYTVKAGDTLGKIAKANGTTVKALEAENNLTTTRINVGKKLKLPKKAEAAPVAPVENAAPMQSVPPPAPMTAPASAPTTN